MAKHMAKHSEVFRFGSRLNKFNYSDYELRLDGLTVSMAQYNEPYEGMDYTQDGIEIFTLLGMINRMKDGPKTMDMALNYERINPFKVTAIGDADDDDGIEYHFNYLEYSDDLNGYVEKTSLIIPLSWGMWMSDIDSFNEQGIFLPDLIEVIRHIVREKHGRYPLCHMNSLKEFLKDPNGSWCSVYEYIEKINVFYDVESIRNEGYIIPNKFNGFPEENAD